MNTLALKTAQTVDTDTKAMQDKIYVVIEAGKKQLKRLAWLFERHPGFVEQNLLDKNLGLEVRRLRW